MSELAATGDDIMKRLKWILGGSLVLASATGCTGAVDSNEVPTDEPASSALSTYAELKYGDEKTVDFLGTDYWVGYKFTGVKGDIVDMAVTPMTAGADAYVYLYSGDFGVTRRDAPDTSIQFTETLKRTGVHYLLVHNDKKLAAQFKVSVRTTATNAVSDAGTTSDAGAATDAATDASTTFEHGAITDLFAFNSTEPTTPATKQDLAALFAPGSVKTTVGMPIFVQRTRGCHSVTGCTKWEPTVAPELGYYKGSPLEPYDEAVVLSLPLSQGRVLVPTQVGIADGLFRFTALLPAYTNSFGTGSGTVGVYLEYAPDKPPPAAPTVWGSGVRSAWRLASRVVYDRIGNDGSSSRLAFTTNVTKTYAYGRTPVYGSLVQSDGVYFETEYALYLRMSLTQVLTPTAAGETLAVTW